MTAASVTEVLSRCRATASWTVGMCGQFCARMYGYSASGYTDALTQWQRTPAALKHPGATDAPPGALLFWGGGSAGHGHVAVAAGDGSCHTIDIAGPGTVTQAPANLIHTLWGLPYLGWAEPYFQGQKWSPVVIYGLDVAVYQAAVIPSRTPSDNKPVDFVLIKATQGTSYINPRMAAQAESARQQGMVVGFYHFLEKGNVQAQCEYFVRHAASVEGDLLAVDWETNPATDTYPTNADKDAAIRAVQTLRPGHKVLLYCNTSFWKNIDTTSFAGDGLWIADPNHGAGLPAVQSAWLMHQYSTAGSYDHNVAQFDSRSGLRAWAEEGSDVALSADDKKWITAQLTATSLVDGKAHGSGYYLAHAEKSAADALAQSRTNGGSLTEIKTVLAAVRNTLASLDLSGVPAEVAAKIESLKLIVTVEDTSS